MYIGIGPKARNYIGVGPKARNYIGVGPKARNYNGFAGRRPAATLDNAHGRVASAVFDI